MNTRFGANIAPPAPAPALAFGALGQKSNPRDIGHTDGRVWYMIRPDAPMLVVTKPHDGQPATAGNGSMTALPVPSQEAVRAVYAKAIELGATDEGGPGHRSSDPGDLYRAYFRDPDGNKLMVFTWARA